MVQQLLGCSVTSDSNCSGCSTLSTAIAVAVVIDRKWALNICPVNKKYILHHRCYPKWMIPICGFCPKPNWAPRHWESCDMDHVTCAAWLVAVENFRKIPGKFRKIFQQCAANSQNILEKY